MDTDDEQRAVDAFNRGKAYMDKQMYNEAIAEYTEAVRIHPKFLPAYIGRGIAHDSIGQPDRGIADFTDAIRGAPKDPVGYSNRGNTLLMIGKHDQAVADYTQAIALDPKNPMRYAYRGRAYTGKGDYDRAIADFTRAIQLNPLDANSFLGRGQAYRESGRDKSAMKDFAEAIGLDAQATEQHFFWRGQDWGEKGELDKEIAEYDLVLSLHPRFALGYEARANAHAEKGAYDKAIADYSEAIRLAPLKANAFFMRGDIYVKKGDYGLALADLNEGVRLDPKDPRVKQRGWLCFTKGQYDQAIADCASAIEHFGEDEEGLIASLLLRSEAFVEKAEYDRALADVNEAIRLDPENPAAHNDRGWVYSNKGELDKAVAAYSEAIRLDPSFLLAYENRAEACSSKGDFDRAIADATTIIRADPTAAGGYMRRAIAYVGKNDHQRAIADFTETIRLDPQVAAAYYNRGICHAAEKRYEKAIADFTEAIRLDPEDFDHHFQRGSAYGEIDENEKAVVDLTEAIRLAPNKQAAYELRATAYRALGETEKAAQDERNAMAVVDERVGKARLGSLPESADQCWETGRILVESENCDEAIACFDKALALAPADTATYAERGNAYLFKGDYDAAIADFTQFIHLNGSESAYVQGHRSLEVVESGDATIVTFTEKKIFEKERVQDIGEQLLSLVDELGRRNIIVDFQNVEFVDSGILNRLIALLRELSAARGRLTLCNMNPEIYELFEITELSKLFNIGLHPGEKSGRLGVGQVASSLKPPNAADFLQSLHWRRGLTTAYANRGAAFSCKGDYDAAIADYTEAIKLRCRFVNVYVNRGNAYFGKKDYARAIADHTEAIRLGDRNALGERAKAYRALGDDEKAAEDERRVSACDYSARGEAHLANGDAEQAIAAHTQAIRLAPNSERYAARARAFKAIGCHDQAVADFSEAIRLTPKDATLYWMRATLYEVMGDRTLATEDERKLKELVCGLNSTTDSHPRVSDIDAFFADEWGEPDE